MFIKDVMTRRVQVVRPASTLKEAAQIMKVADIGPLPVCDGDRLVGVITDRDITIKGVAEGRDPLRTQVQEIMNPEVLYAYDDQEIAVAARIMEEKHVARVIVVNRSKRLVGIVSTSDLAKRIVENEQLTQLIDAVVSPSSN